MTAAKRAPNSLADLVRVAGELRADPTVIRTAAVLLGLEAPSAPAAPSFTPVLRDPQPTLAVSPQSPRTTDTAAAEIRPAGDDPRPPRRPLLIQTEPAAADPPRRLPGSVFDLLPTLTPTHADPEPLLEPTHQRAVLSGLVALDRPGREVDIETLVDRMVRREPVGIVPRLYEPTTRLGVRLLVDRSPSMDPFRRDVGLLTAALRRVIGADAVKVHNFRGDPNNALPAAGGPHPILLASDLGIAATSGAPWPSMWLRLADAAREAGSPIVALVPYPSSRWPRWSVGRLTLVHWDRQTDAGHASRAARRAALLAGMFG